MERSKKRSSIYSKKRISKRKKARNRAGALLCLAMIAAAVTGFCLMKTITVEADGKDYKVVTFGSTYAQALENKSITVGPEDKTVPSLDSKIEKGGTIKITRAASVIVNVDGKVLRFGTSAANVGDILKAKGIKISQYDKVSPSVNTKVNNGMAVTIVRVTTSDISSVTPVAFTAATKEDSTLLKGATKIVQNGVQGEKTTVTRITYENGKEVSRAVVSDTVTKQPFQEITAVGSKVASSTTTTVATPAATAPVAAASGVTDSRGASISYSKVMPVMATAYSEEECGGLMTFSGVNAVWDPNGWSTIAVDPSIIPLGTKVYVEGYGYAIAQDTGSAIIGNHIDCFFYTNADMNAWGTRTVNVYILN